MKTREPDPERSRKHFALDVLRLREDVILGFLEQVVTLMQRKDLKRSDVARRLGKSKAYVTQLLDGPNMTLGTVAALALAVGAQARLVLEDRGYEGMYDVQPARTSAAGEAAASGDAWHIHVIPEAAASNDTESIWA